MPAFSLPPRPPPITRQLHPEQDAPLPKNNKKNCYCHGFGGTLKPRYIIGAQPLDQ